MCAVFLYIGYIFLSFSRINKDFVIYLVNQFFVIIEDSVLESQLSLSMMFYIKLRFMNDYLCEFKKNKIYLRNIQNIKQFRNINIKR